MDAIGLVAFENKVAAAFESKKIRAPIHLVGGNEEKLIDIFKGIKRTDWVLSTWRSHYHALLHGVPEKRVMDEILAGRSMMLHFPEYRFMTSAIVGGMLPIACGLAAAGERVWCFIGDMAATVGAFHEARQYASKSELPVTFVIEDNGLSTNTPTKDTWGKGWHQVVMSYGYERTRPHCGSGTYVSF
jgi:TPP-dependent pyruvate/acetoin dehydrogenase alpha subunit